MNKINIFKNFVSKNYVTITFFVLVSLILSVEGCTRTSQSALRKLNKLNIPYTTDQFLTNAQKGNKKVVELFLQAGMNVNTINENGQTALMLSALNGHINTVKLLIKHGAYIDLIDKSGDTALSLASKANHTDIVKLLKKAEINKSY